MNMTFQKLFSNIISLKNLNFYLTLEDYQPIQLEFIKFLLFEGNLYRVQDMYTRDRSTPRPDDYYLGNDDITGAAGSQIDGITTNSQVRLLA